MGTHVRDDAVRAALVKSLLEFGARVSAEDLRPEPGGGEEKK
jgi:hypothetical protein